MRLISCISGEISIKTGSSTIANAGDILLQTGSAASGGGTVSFVTEGGQNEHSAVTFASGSSSNGVSYNSVIVL